MSGNKTGDYLQNTTSTVNLIRRNVTGYIPPTASYFEWVFCYVMTAIFLAFTLYLLIALGVYWIKEKNKQKGKATNNETERKSGGTKFIDRMLVLCIISSILRLILDFWIEISCSVSMSMNIGLAALCLALVYLILWRRQRLLYRHKVMLVLASPLINVLSWLTLGLMIIAIILNFVFFIFLGIDYNETSSYTCEFGESNDWAIVKWSVLATSTVTFQSILVGLFVYPLCNHEKKMQESNLHRTSASLKPLFRRILITALVCMLSDIVMATVASLVERPTGEIYSLVYTIDINVNIVSIICSFSDWKQRLMPFCKDSVDPKTVIV
uniref:uncharacterized protein LOC120326466 n=1 Tax=Styela clava TaxID=7725 RepID=UPI00193A618D|nr:uncharacterized protein LOC120326466 [Styela clava]